jgi:hypothetical protein
MDTPPVKGISFPAEKPTGAKADHSEFVTMKKTKKHKTPAGSPSIRCAHTDLAPTSSLNPNPENPNLHSAEQLALYAKILRHQGWRKAIVVSKQSGLIVTGHGAWQTATQQGWPQVPVDRQDFASKADEIAHMLADNGLPQMAEMKESELKKLLASLDAELRELTGFELDELEQMLVPPEFPITAKLNEAYDYVLVFTENETDFAHLQTLFGVQTESSYKKTGIGIGRCVPFERCLKALHENHHSLHVPRGNDDDPQAAEKLSRRRSRKPAKRLPAGDASGAHAS